MTRRRVLNVVALVAVVAVVAPFVVYAVPQIVGAEQSFVVLSGSMEPAMSPGDVVVVSAHESGVGIVGALASVGLVDDPGSGIERGDVITFATSGDEPPTTHRVVEVVDTDSGEAYRTKGDANEDPDRSLVRPQQVVGEVVLVFPYVGYVVQFVDTRVGFAALVVLPLGLLAVSELYAIFSTSEGSGDGAGGGPDGGSGGDGGTPTATDSDGDALSHDAGGGQARIDGDDLHPGDGTPPELRSPPVDPAAAIDPADAGSDGENSTAYSFSHGELGLALAILVAVAPYAGFVAYNDPAAWSITAAVAAALTLAFVAMAYWQTAPSGERSPDATGFGATPVVPAGRPEGDDRERVPVDSVESLVDLAIEGGDWLFADEDGYFLLRERAVYVHDGSAGGDDPAPVEPANEAENGASTGREREDQ